MAAIVKQNVAYLCEGMSSDVILMTFPSIFTHNFSELSVWFSICLVLTEMLFADQVDPRLENHGQAV